MIQAYQLARAFWPVLLVAIAAILAGSGLNNSGPGLGNTGTGGTGIPTTWTFSDPWEADRDSIATETDLLPWLGLRIDDVGSMPDTDSLAIAFIEQGLVPTYSVQYGYATDNWDSDIGGYAGTSFSEQWSRIQAAHDDYDVPIYVMDHGRYSFNIVKMGGSQTWDSSCGTTCWRQWDQFTDAQWEMEVNADSIEARFGVRPDGFVWPGDPGVREYGLHRPNLFTSLFRAEGYNFGVTGHGATEDSNMVCVGEVTNTTGTVIDPVNALFPFSLYQLTNDKEKFMIPMRSTMDLSANYVMERHGVGDSGAPNWLPAGTTRWTLGEANAIAWDHADDPTPANNHTRNCNNAHTWNSQIAQSIARNSALAMVVHSKRITYDRINDSTNNQTFTYPIGASADSLVFDGAGTLGGHTSTLGDIHDYRYLAAKCRALVDAGVVRWGTVGDMVRWAARKPATGSVAFGTTDIVHPFVAIGDTAGIDHPFFRSFGTLSMSSTLPVHTNQALGGGTIVVDPDHNGQLWDAGEDGEYGDGSSGAPKWYILADKGPTGGDALLWKNSDGGYGSNSGSIRIISNPLPPGQYTMRYWIQNVTGVQLFNNTTHDARPSGMTDSVAVEPNTPVDAYSRLVYPLDSVAGTDLDTVMAAASTAVLAAAYKPGHSPWPGGAWVDPGTGSEAWFPFTKSFSLPDVPTGATIENGWLYQIPWWWTHQRVGASDQGVFGGMTITYDGPN